MVRHSLTVCALMLLIVHEVSAQKGVELPGTDVAAIIVAGGDFRARYPRVDLRHFDVAISHHAGAVEVTFIPRDPPNRNQTYAGIGGETAYGPEMHFFVSAKTLKVMRYHYAR